MRIYIYKFEFPNGKIYIGQTKDYIVRWDRHSRSYRNSRKNMPVDYAIRKYGWKNIKKSVILICDSNMGNYFEEKLILIYKTLDRKYGYNLQPGGQSQTTTMGRYLKFKQIRKPILRYDAVTGFFEKWYPNLSFAAKDNNTTDSAISQILNINNKKNLTLHKKIFIKDSYSRKKRLNILDYQSKKSHPYLWYVFDTLENKILPACTKLKEVGKITNSALQTMKNYLSEVIKYKKKYKNRYFIIRTSIPTPIEDIKQQFQTIINDYLPPTYSSNCKPIKVISKNTKKILHFNSAAEAARSLELNEKYVRRAASREKSVTGYYKGYYFNYV